MAVDIVGITNLYDSLATNILSKYDNLYTNDKIDAETYAKLVGESMTALQKIAVDAVQNQELLDKQVESESARKLNIEKDTETKERNTIINENQSVKDIELKSKEIELKSKQIESLDISDKLKQDVTDADVKIKTAQKAVQERQASKIETDITNSIDDNTRKNDINKRDVALKAAQTTVMYRDGMLKEQQQLLLTNQTEYEAEKTETLRTNTEANALIRLIDGTSAEITSYITNGVVPPSELLNILAQARYDLVSLTNVDVNQYEKKSYAYTFRDVSSDGEADGSQNRDTRTYDNRTISTYTVNKDDRYLTRNGVVYKFTNATATSVNLNTVNLTTDANWEQVIN